MTLASRTKWSLRRRGWNLKASRSGGLGRRDPGLGRAQAWTAGRPVGYSACPGCITPACELPVVAASAVRAATGASPVARPRLGVLPDPQSQRPTVIHRDRIGGAGQVLRAGSDGDGARGRRRHQDRGRGGLSGSEHPGLAVGGIGIDVEVSHGCRKCVVAAVSRAVCDVRRWSPETRRRWPPSPSRRPRRQ